MTAGYVRRDAERTARLQQLLAAVDGDLDAGYVEAAALADAA